MIQISASDLLSEMLDRKNHYITCNYYFVDEKNNYLGSYCTNGKVETSVQQGKRRKKVVVDCPECGGTGELPSYTLTLLREFKHMLDNLDKL